MSSVKEIVQEQLLLGLIAAVRLFIRTGQPFKGEPETVASSYYIERSEEVIPDWNPIINSNYVQIPKEEDYDDWVKV